MNFKLFNRNKIFYHEDSYCLIQLIEKKHIFLKELIGEKIDKNLFTDLGGFEIVSLPEEMNLLGLNINSKDVSKIISKYNLTYYSIVQSGHSNYVEREKDVTGWGFENYVLYVQSKRSSIYNIWLDFHFLSETLNVFPVKLEKCLLEIGEKWDLYLVDWNENVSFSLKNKSALREYCDFLTPKNFKK